VVQPISKSNLFETGAARVALPPAALHRGRRGRHQDVLKARCTAAANNDPERRTDPRVAEISQRVALSAKAFCPSRVMVPATRPGAIAARESFPLPEGPVIAAASPGDSKSRRLTRR
jgi:hypothetical protein